MQAFALRLVPSILTALSLAAMAYAQSSPAAPTFTRNIIVLDPAHGGSDTGARIADNLPEKAVTLAFAARLRPLLTAAGFTVVATRDADLADPTQVLTTDQRAGTANHGHALACLLIHATPSGSGVHLFTSTLSPSTNDGSSIIPWDTAQSAYLSLSVRLANELGVSLLHSNVTPLLGHASIRPLDNLTCPAVALELAPLVNPGAEPTPLSNNAYQQRIAQAITAALVSWRDHAAPAPVTPSRKPATPRPATTTPPVGDPR